MPAATAGASLARGAAATTIATAISRVTGFVRVVVVAGAMGTTFLANTYQTANTAPNVVFELVAAGVLTSVFVPTFVEYIVRGDREEGWRAANALTSFVVVGLIAMALLLGLFAPWVMRALTIGVEDEGLRAREVALGATFLRLFAPQIVFYGVGMIMTGALHAHRRFGLPAIAPIFNNIIVIGVYVAYAMMRGDRPASVDGITTAETWLLGAGTTAGVVAMTVCLIPQLRKLGWRFRPNLDRSHPAVRRGARLGVWALGYAGGYQAGLIVVLILANRVEGGVAAYQWAYTFFYLPHALFGVPIFNVLFTAMSEHAARDEVDGAVGRLRDGLSMLAFLLIPIAAMLFAAAELVSRVTLRYGVMTTEGSDLVGHVLQAFAIGLPSYSAFLVFTRAFYAIGDTKTPAVVNAGTVLLASAAGALFFSLAPDGWEVPGLAFGHSVGFFVGAAVMARVFGRRAGTVGGTRVSSSVVRSLALGLAAGAAMLAAASAFDARSNASALVALVVVAIVGAVVYLGGMVALKAPEIGRLRGLVASR
jgi:putative peptidoglycan lipid II flippase